MKQPGINLPMLVASVLMIAAGIYAVNVDELWLYSYRSVPSQ